MLSKHKNNYLLIFLLGLSTIILGLIFCRVCYLVVQRVLENYVNYLPEYALEDVNEVCQKLELDQTDEFCVDPRKQNATSFEAMLNRNFPVGVTTLDDLNPFLPFVAGRSWEECFERYADVVSNLCDPGKSCKNTDNMCSVSLHGTISEVYIFFDRTTDQVTHYRVIRPGW